MRFRIIQPAIMNPDPPWNYVTDRYAILQNKIVERLGGEVYFDDNPPMDGDVDAVLGYNLHFEPEMAENVLKASKDIILLVHWNDLHAVGKRIPSQMIRLMERADVVFAPYKYAFNAMWPEFKNLFVWLPHFIAPTERYSEMPFNEDPIRKCLVTGAAPRTYYPLRHFLIHNISDDCERLTHPGYRLGRREDAKVGGDYAKELNKYLCSVATCSRLDYSLGKYMEIPASGCLLLGQWTPDLDDFGFVDGENYVRVDESNVFDTIHDVVNNPGKYEGIRRTGREFALANFGVEHRVNRVCDIVGEMFSGL